MNKYISWQSFKKIFQNCLCLLFLLFIIGCKKHKTIRTKVDTFWVAEYEFEVIRFQKIKKKTYEVVADRLDTILVNLCDFCSECEEIKDDTGYRR